MPPNPKHIGTLISIKSNWICTGNQCVFKIEIIQKKFCLHLFTLHIIWSISFLLYNYFIQKKYFNSRLAPTRLSFFYCRTALKPNTLKAFMLTGQVSMYIEFKKRIWKPKYNPYDINLYVIHVNIDKLGGMKRGIWFWICSQSCKFKFVYVNCVVWGVW